MANMGKTEDYKRPPLNSTNSIGAEFSIGTTQILRARGRMKNARMSFLTIRGVGDFVAARTSEIYKRDFFRKKPFSVCSQYQLTLRLAFP